MPHLTKKRKSKKIVDTSERFDIYSYSDMSNFGGSNIFSQNSDFRKERLSKYELDYLYTTDGITRKIVSLIVDDALRGFIDCDSLLLKELRRIKAKQHIHDACCFGRLYGGSLLMPIIDDGLELSQPLNYDRIFKVMSLKVFDRHQVTISDKDIISDVYNEYFGEPEYYTLTVNVGYSVQYVKVHRSRVFIFGGANTPNSRKAKNNSWDDSVILSCFNAIESYVNIVSSATSITRDFTQTIIRLKGLSQQMSSKNGATGLRKRLELIDNTRSTKNAIILDAEEEYNKIASSVAGLADLWDRYSEYICACSGKPATKLFGRSPAGLSSTGYSDMNNWHDQVNSFRSDILEPCNDWLINILKVQKAWKTKPDNYEFTFKSLVNNTDMDEVEIRYKVAQTDAIYVNSGAVNADELFKERYKNGAFHLNINTDDLSSVNIFTEEENEEIDNNIEDVNIIKNGNTEVNNEQ